MSTAKVRLTVMLFGVAFGFLLSWGAFTNPDVIQQMLLLESFYMYGMLGTAVIVGFVGVRLARRYLRTSLVTREPISWSVTKPTAQTIWGSSIFGLGWALSDACPGPVAAQLGQGWGWSLFTLAGILVGVLAHMRWQEAGARSAQGETGLPSAPASTSLPYGSR